MDNTHGQLKIAIIGSNGRMGNLMRSVISLMPHCAIVANITRSDDLDLVLKSVRPDIAIDVTSHESVFNNSIIIISNGVCPIIGTSGLTVTEIEYLSSLCISNNIGGAIVPNFSLGIALLCKLTAEFKKYYNEFALVEFHHSNKKDKPSGTARYIANILGKDENDIASVRSNIFVAKQQIYINGEGERIVLDQESFDRSSFAKGIEVCINRVLELKSLVVGLENIIPNV